MRNNYLIEVLTSYVLYNMSISLYRSFFPIHLDSLGASMFIISLASAIPALTIVIATPLWGMLSYKIRSRKLFIMMGLVANVLCLMIFNYLKTPLEYIGILGFFSIFTSALQPNLETQVTHMIEKKGRAGGLLLTSRSMGLTIGALSGGLIFEIFGIRTNFILGATSSAIAILILIRFKEKRSQNINGTKFFNLTPYRTLLKDRNIFPIYLTTFMYSFGMTVFVGLFPVYFIGIGGSKTLLGITNSAIYIIAILISMPAGILADRVGRKPLIIIATTIGGLIMGALYLTNDPLITAMLWAIPLHPYILISSIALISDFTDEANRGVGIGLLLISQSFARVIGPLIGGLLADLVSLRGLLPLSSFISLLAGIVSLVFIKERKSNMGNITRAHST
jgi:MFS family permease